ncbi:MAG: glycosyltransferase family 4 protein, partial [Solirubrobacteraceae bacterium]
VYGAGLALQQPRLLEQADAVIVLSERHGAALARSGLPQRPGWVWTLPNFLPAGALAPAPPSGPPEHLLAAGRLVEEKGFDTAIAAARRADVPLVIAGEGPDLDRLRRLAAGARVSFPGWLDRRTLAEARARAAAVLVPSRCEEACPYAVLEALAAGIPALVSDRGGLPEMVPAGSVLPAEDVAAWAQAVGRVWSDGGDRGQRGREALAIARERFGEDLFYRRLMEIYAGEPT